MSGSNALANAFANANKPTVAIQSPFELMRQAGENAQLMNANRLFQANALRGQLIGQATDADGNYDGLKFNRLAAGAGPGYAPAAAAGLDQSTRIGGEQQTQALKNLTVQSTALDSLGPNATYQQVHDKVSEGVKAGWLQPAGANSVLVGMPQGDDPQSRATRSHILQTIGDQVRTATERLQSQNGVPTIVDRGGQKIPGAIDSRGGAFTPAGTAITNTTTPAEKISPVTGPAGPRGQPTTQPSSAYALSHGLDPDTGNPLPHPAFKDLPTTLRGPNQQPAAAPTQTGLGPADTTAMTETGGTSSKAYDATSQAGVKAISQRALLQNMAGDATQFTTGPGAAGIKNLKATIQRIGNIFGLSPIDADKLAANEDLDKVAAQLADAQGAGSDARLAVNQGANPSSHNTPAGLRLILNKLTGNADYLAARAQLAQQYQRTKDPTSANNRTFETEIGAKLDPRVFQFNRLDADQQKQYLSEMPTQAARDAFKRSYFEHRDQMKVFPGG